MVRSPATSRSTLWSRWPERHAGYVHPSASALIRSSHKENNMNTRTIAIAALIIAVILVIVLFVV